MRALHTCLTAALLALAPSVAAQSPTQAPVPGGFGGTPAAPPSEEAAPGERPPTFFGNARGTCFTPGRRMGCVFTLDYDAATGEFTKLHAVRTGDPTDSTWTRLPLRGATIPVLTGDLVNVRVLQLRHGERVSVGTQVDSAPPMPRPSIPSSLGLGIVSLEDRGTPRLPDRVAQTSGKPLEPSASQGVEAFRAEWDRVVTRHLRYYSRALEDSAQHLRTRLAALTLPPDPVTPLLSAHAHAAETAKEAIERACVAHGTERQAAQCIAALNDASLLSRRQEALQRAVEARSALSTPADALVRAAVELLNDPAATHVLRNPIGPYQELAERVTDEDWANGVGLYGRTAGARNLRGQRQVIVADTARMRAYALLHGHLDAIHSRLSELQVDEKEDARHRLAAAWSALAVAFDAGASIPRGPLVRGVHRSRGDDGLSVTVSLSPRYAELPGPAPESPKTPAATPAQDPAGEGSGTAAAAAAKDTRETATQRIVTRRRHYLQVAAGFVFTNVESSRWGERDVLVMRDPDGDGTPQEVTVRQVTRTELRPRTFVPAAHLVFHPLGKDVDPDAYGNWHTLIPGIALGTTLDDPAENFTLGFTWEPFPGIHLSGGGAWMQVERLQDGFSEGAEIPLDAEAPVRSEFARGWYAGGLLDVDVFTSFFLKLLKPQ